MTSSQRIVVNTAAQYTRTILNVCLSLYSTRLILSAMGQSDFGIYSLVAGIVAMLSFITNALVISTQRFLSYYHGAHNEEKVRTIFSNSLWLHLLIGLGLSLILCIISKSVIHSFLNIDSARENAAMMVYMASVIMLFLTLITAPFRALFIARENILYLSIIDVIDGILKLLLAVWLTHIAWDKLEMYGWGMACIQGFNLFALGIFALSRFSECHIPTWKDIDKNYLHELSDFAGWTIYSTGCIIARTQGISILLNQFFGTIVNAAYGIALQVVGAVNFMAQSIITAMDPQIMKAEGAHDRNTMISLAEKASKYAFLLLALVAVPLIAEMDAVLLLWLGEVPEWSTMFCQFVLAAALCDQLTTGLGCANQAIGKIRAYSLIINSIKVLTLPAAWICLRLSLPIASVMICYLVFEFLCAMARLPFLKMTAGINITQYIQRVFIRVIGPSLALIIAGYVCINYVHFEYRFIFTFIICLVVGIISIYFTALEKEEKQYINHYLHKINKSIVSC